MTSLMKLPITSPNNQNIYLVVLQVEKNIKYVKYKQISMSGSSDTKILRLTGQTKANPSFKYQHFLYNLYPITKFFITNFAQFQFRWIFSG